MLGLALIILCGLSEVPVDAGNPLLSWGSTQVRIPSVRRPSYSRPISNDMMQGVMDKMPSDAKMLTKPPPNFSMLPSSNRIVNGHTAHISDYPYQLQMSIYGRQACGASIISQNWAISAAHCMFDNAGRKIPLNAITFRAGATHRDREGSVHMIEMRVMPGQYDPRSHNFDIALLKVSRPFVFSSKVQAIPLDSKLQRKSDGDVGILTGWGHTKSGGSSSDTLQYVLVPLVNQKKCERAYNTPERKITHRMICAGSVNRDSCQGDSGGPLAVNGRLVGIVSFGIGCALEGYPGVNTRVSEYRDFIRKYTGV